jgi:hypothetical protein
MSDETPQQGTLRLPAEPGIPSTPHSVIRPVTMSARALEIYLTYEGEVRGPAPVEDVQAGRRTSFYPDDTTFWFEGRADWAPLDEFDAALAAHAEKEGRKAAALAAQIREWRTSGDGRKRRRRHHKGGRTPRPPQGKQRGYLVVVAAVLAAVILTAGILLLMSGF